MKIFNPLLFLLTSTLIIGQNNPFRVNAKNNHLQLIGSWTFESMTTITKAKREEIKIVYKDNNNVETLLFNKSGSISYDVLNEGLEKKGQGIWFAEQNYLTIIVDSDTTYGTYNIEDNTLTIITETKETDNYYGYSTIIKYKTN